MSVIVQILNSIREQLQPQKIQEPQKTQKPQSIQEQKQRENDDGFPELQSLHGFLEVRNRTHGTIKVSESTIASTIANWGNWIPETSGNANRALACYILSSNGRIPLTRRTILDLGTMLQSGVFQKKIFGESFTMATIERWSRVPVDQVHRVMIDDLRFNMTKRDQSNVILDENDNIWAMQNEDTWQWKKIEKVSFLYVLPQAKENFSRETQAYIDNLDAGRDREVLEQHNITFPRRVHRIHHLTIEIIKITSGLGYNIREITAIIRDGYEEIRKFPEQTPSDIIKNIFDKSAIKRATQKIYEMQKFTCYPKMD